MENTRLSLNSDKDQAVLFYIQKIRELQESIRQAQESIDQYNKAVQRYQQRMVEVVNGL